MGVDINPRNIELLRTRLPDHTIVEGDVELTKLDALLQQDRETLKASGGHQEIEAAIANYEMAYRMQASAPELMDLAKESKETLEMYGAEPGKPSFANNCLLARRLIERGVRFVELFHESWDQHGNLKKGHEKNALDTDQGIAALLKDLKQRGLLDETLIVWAGEFGRTPHSPGRDGRDHHPEGFSLWLAGGGIKGGTVYGATDEMGMHAEEGVCTMHDLHATILHLLGLDHERLTYRFGGRDFRLTDVHGHVVREILA